MHRTIHDVSANLKAWLFDAAESMAGLPGEAYTSDAFLAFEYQELFARTWTCIGLTSDVASAGDAIPVTVAGQPLLMVRDARDRIQAFHNVCSHRGAQLVSHPVKGRRALICPYHAWSYGLDGALRKTPHVGGQGRHRCAHLNQGSLGLKPVRTAVWHSLVFVNLSGDAPTLEQHLQPLSDRWRAYDLSLLRHGGSLHFDVRANWKLIIENFVESYHLPWVHPNLNRYSAMRDHYQILGGGLFVGQGSTAYGPQDAGTGALPCFPGITGDATMRAEYVCLFPNVLLGCLVDHFYAVILQPVAPDRTLERFELLYVGHEALAPELGKARQAPIDRRNEINREDIDIVQRLQAGRTSIAFTGGVFSPAQEETVSHFQRMVAHRLTASQPNPATALPALPFRDLHPHASEAVPS